MSITQTKNFTITFGTAPYTYVWTTADSCLSVTNPSGTSTDGSITDIVFVADNENCFPVNATVTVTDSSDNPCVKSFVFAIANPCTSFTLSSISRVGNYTFSTSASESATFSWLFDDDLFTAVGSTTSSTVILTLGRQPLPDETSFVSVIATNEAGCQETESFNVTFNVPLAGNTELTSPCASNFASTGYFDLPLTSTDTIDWATLNIGVPANFSYEVNGLDQVKLEWRTVTGTTSPGTVQFPYTVATEYDIISNEGLITWTIGACTEEGEDLPFAASPGLHVSPDQQGDVIEVAFTASSDYNPALNEFLASPDQSVSGDGKTLTTVEGEAIIYNDNFTYEQTNPTPTVETEPIQFRLTNWENKKGPINITCVSLNTLPQPTIANKNICSSCLTPTPFMQLDDVDSGDDLVDPSTLLVKTSPTLGTITTSADGRVKYTQDPTASGTPDTFELTWRDYNGRLSNTAVFTVNRNCTGRVTDAIVDITCTAKSFDLTDLLDGIWYVGSSTWSEVNAAAADSYTTQGGTITDPTGIGTVDFTLINPGTYQFKREATVTGGAPSVNCPLTVTTLIDITFGPDPDLTITGTTNTSGDYYRVDFSIEGVASPSEITVTVNTLPAVIVSAPTFIGSSGSVLLELSPGSNDIEIQANTICAGSVSDTVNVTY